MQRPKLSLGEGGHISYFFYSCFFLFKSQKHYNFVLVIGTYHYSQSLFFVIITTLAVTLLYSSYSYFILLCYQYEIILYSTPF
jgi:hypothetical protein